MILSLANIYRSMLGIINTVFSISMILVAFRFWQDATWIYRVPILLGIALFPVLQPLAIYLRSKRIASQIPDGLEIHIGTEGISICNQSDSTTLAYSDLRAVHLVAGTIVIQTRGQQGYALSRHVLGDKTQEVYDLLKRRMRTS